MVSIAQPVLLAIERVTLDSNVVVSIAERAWQAIELPTLDSNVVVSIASVGPPRRTVAYLRLDIGRRRVPMAIELPTVASNVGVSIAERASHAIGRVTLVSNVGVSIADSRHESRVVPGLAVPLRWTSRRSGRTARAPKSNDRRNDQRTIGETTSERSAKRCREAIGKTIFFGADYTVESGPAAMRSRTRRSNWKRNAAVTMNTIVGMLRSDARPESRRNKLMYACRLPCG